MEHLQDIGFLLSERSCFNYIIVYIPLKEVVVMNNKITLKVTAVIAILTFATFFIAIGSLSLGTSTSAFAQVQPKYFDAKLTGKDEVPSKDTKATGIAGLNVIDNKTINYSVNVTNIQKVTGAHIHQGKAGVNGPVVVTLYNSTTPSPMTNGILSKGDITSTKFEGPLAGKQVSDLISMIKSGDAYVNVHTEVNPKGEIRGQLSAM